MDKAKILSIIVLVLSIASVSNAINIIYVDVNGPNDPGTGTSDDPFRRIQNAIDAANASDIVEIRPGIYTADPNNYNLDPNGKSITIRSTEPNDPEMIANTIIDPNDAGRGFYFISGEDTNCVISGLTIRNGLAADDSGGAILCYQSSPTISNCIIIDNVADWYGGAVFCYDSSPEITGCVITGNSAMDGGALECWSGTVKMQKCVISNNTASGNGGAIDCYWEGQAEVDNCTVVKNSADTGGALRCVDEGKATIQNSIFWSNDAAEGAQIALEHSPFSTSEVTISYSDAQGGISAVYVDPCSILNWGSGNIDTDPCFASFDLDGDPNMRDFHLQSAYGRFDAVFYKIDFNHDGVINLLDFAKLANRWLEKGYNLPEDLNRSGAVDEADLQIFSEYYLSIRQEGKWAFDRSTSPCIDAGDPNSDWSGELWPNGKRINMGSFGGTIQASMNGNPADFDIDGMVNFVDFAGFADKWFAEEFCIEDLTGNGVVDFADLRIFIDNWLWQRE